MNLVKPDPNIQEPSIQQQEGFFPPIVQNVHSIVNGEPIYLASGQIQYGDYFCIKNKKNKITQKPKGIYEATFTILHKEKEKIKEFEVDISFDFKKISYSDTSEPSEVKTIIQFSVITIREIRIYDGSGRILFGDEINSYNERAEELKKILFQILKKISGGSLEVIGRQLIQ